MFLFGSEFLGLVEFDNLQASSTRQNIIPLFTGSLFKSFQVAFCANPCIAFALQQRIAVKRHSQGAAFAKTLSVQRLEKQAF